MHFLACRRFSPFVVLVLLIPFQILLSKNTEAVKLEITHWNDINGQIEHFYGNSSRSSKAPIPCPGGAGDADRQLNCVGGVINLVHHIHEKIDADVEDANRLRLGTGNLIGGESGWISAIGWKPYTEYIKQHFDPAAVALGMKEFGAGVSRTIDFINAMDNNVATVGNTCLQPYTDPDEQKFCALLIKFITKTINGSPIGIIGFVTPTVEKLSLPGKLKFSGVADALKNIVSQQGGIKTFIAIGDGNLNLAKEIIDSVPQIGLVIYGAGLSNTEDMSKSEYPLKYKNSLIATAGRYGSTIGKLVVNWDTASGRFQKVSGGIIETSYPTKGYNQQALDAHQMYNELEGPVDKEKNNTVGHAGVELEGGEICWRGECNLGNLITDAMVHCLFNQAATVVDFPVHSVWHGGAFFEDKITPKSPITKFDIHKWLPYHNRAHLVSITGKNLKTVLDKSASGLDPDTAGEKDWRQFLQVSNGMEVYYNTKSGAPKLDKIRMTHNDGGVPELGDIEDGQSYKLIIPTYLFEGRGVYTNMDKLWSPYQHGNVTSNFAFDDDCVEDYIRSIKQVSVGFEERIWINGKPRGDDDDNGCKGSRTALTVILTIVFYTIFLAILFIGYFYVLPRLMRPAPDLQSRYPPNQL